MKGTAWYGMVRYDKVDGEMKIVGMFARLVYGIKLVAYVGVVKSTILCISLGVRWCGATVQCGNI